jgi:hypothetical protein
MSHARTEGVPNRIIVLRRLAKNRGCEKFSVDSRQRIARAVQRTCIAEMKAKYGPEGRRKCRAMAFAKARNMRKKVRVEHANAKSS